MSSPSPPTRPERRTSAEALPAVRIDIVVRDDMARDVVITINGVPIVSGNNDEP